MSELQELLYPKWQPNWVVHCYRADGDWCGAAFGETPLEALERAYWSDLEERKMASTWELEQLAGYQRMGSDEF